MERAVGQAMLPPQQFVGKTLNIRWEDPVILTIGQQPLGQLFARERAKSNVQEEEGGGGSAKSGGRWEAPGEGAWYA